MSFEELGEAIVNLEYLLEQQVAEISESGPDSKVTLEICMKHRMLACGAILMDYDVAGFVGHLERSGQVYLNLLASRRTYDLDPYYLTASMASPLFDTVAIKDFSRANEISSALPRSSMEDQGETKEEFLSAAVFSELASVEPDRGRVLELLNEMGDILEGQESMELALLANIASEHPDAQTFNRDLHSYAGEWKETIQARRESGAMGPYEGRTSAFIFTEGLAFLRLAERFGIDHESHYPGIPDILISQAYVAEASSSNAPSSHE